MKQYDEIEEITAREDPSSDSEKFNPYHDERGRFATANSYASFTTQTKDPKKQHWADMAMARQKEKTPTAGVHEKPKPAHGNTAEMKGHKSKSYVNTMDDDSVARKVAGELGVSTQKAATMVRDIHKYSGSFYDEIKAASNGAKNGYEKEAKECEDFIKASPKWSGGRIYRGIRDLDPSVRDQILDNAWHGRPIDMRGISSWSSTEKIAKSFAGASGFDKSQSLIFVTNGKSVPNGTSIKHLSQYPQENEVLMSSKATFTPTKVTSKGGITYIFGDFS